MNLSEKLIALRKENSWSQEDFAEKLEVSRQAVSRWENGTALPDAQNILRISKLFNVSADYLLNDDYEGGAEISSVDTAATETKIVARKKNRLFWYLLPVACLVLVVTYFALEAMKPENTLVNEGHTHYEVIRVVENKVAPTCTEQGYYDEVFYCAECGEEISRTRIPEGVPTHHFENQKCTVCGKDQREKH